MKKITRYRRFIAVVSIATTAIGLAVIAGWHLQVYEITALLPGYTSMKVNTAICLMLLGLALFMSLPEQKRIYRMAKSLLAFIIFTIGILTLAEHIFPIAINIDEAFYDYADIVTDHTPTPGRMSPQTAVSLCLLGIALLCIRANNQKLRNAGQYLLHVVTLITFVVLIGYLYHVSELHKLSFVYSMSPQTAIVLLIYSVAATLINPKRGFTAMFTGDMVGNLMARKLFFYVVAGIILILYIRLICHWYNIIPVEFAMAIITVAFVLMTLLLLWTTTARLNKYELKSRIARDNLQVVVESAPYAIITTNGEGIIRMVNKQTEKLFRFDKKELRGKHIKTIIPQHLHGHYEEQSRKVILEGGTHSFGINEELYARNKHGYEFPVELSVCTTKLRKQRAVVVSIIDISLRKKNEQIIKEQLAELQNKNEELEHFNYISSHDLQEPLRTVLNYLTLLDEDYPEMDEELKMHHKAIERAIKRMNMVVRSLLEYGKLGREKKLVRTDIGQLINDVVEDLKAVIEETDTKIEIVCNVPVIFAYETELRQLFQNLISNAIKFRRSDTTPEIQICGNKVNDYYEFSVTDNGIGIPPQHQDKVFHIFQRLNKDEEYEGHGIGLANCKKIAEMHGGKIWVESTPGEGSTFKFTILNFKP